jgi:predicted heme/steroid binding protein
MFSFGTSQKLNLSFSQHVPYSNDYKPLSCISYKSNNILFQKKINSKYCDLKVNIFNSHLDNVNHFNVLLKDENFIGIRHIFGEIYLFTSSSNSLETILKCRVLDITSKFLPPKILFTEKNKSGHLSNYILGEKTFENKFHFLVELPFQNGKREDIRSITVDNKLNIVNEVYNKLDLLFTSKRNNKILLSNNGTVYLLKKFWKKGNHFYIYKLGQEIISEVQIKLNNKKIAALDYFFNSADELVIAGFYSSPVRFNYEGFFLHRYDENLNLVHKNQYLLTENIVKAFKSSKEVRESGFGVDKFIITDFSLDSTGNYYLLSENISKTTIKEETYWVSSGFFVIKFNVNGNYIWGSPVPLNQQHKDLNLIGTFLVNSNHYKRYFYNDLQNLKLRKGIPAEYGILNYCGTKHVEFTLAGLPLENINFINFPGKDSEKYAFFPNQLNPSSNGPSYFAVLNEKSTNIMLAIAK